MRPPKKAASFYSNCDKYDFRVMKYRNVEASRQVNHQGLTASDELYYQSAPDCVTALIQNPRELHIEQWSHGLSPGSRVQVFSF
jgi:hypothetical protein